jgi:hypothetical protein
MWLTDRLRRLAGLARITVIDQVKPGYAGYFVATATHVEWRRIRPWWAVWRRRPHTERPGG